MKHILSRFRYGLLALLFAAGVFAAFVPTDRAAAESRDCDANAVMRCGAYSLSELKRKYRENQNGNTQDIFRHFGINNEAAMDGMVEGRVTADNKVYAGSRLVATDAVTAGRQEINRRGGTSTPILAGAAYERPPSVSFADPNGSLQTYVKLDENGNFKYAVIKSCGNPVKAKPVEKPKPKQPKPEKPVKPVQQPKIPDFEVEKVVRNIDPTDWMEQVDAKPADRLEYRVTIRNTGETDLENIVVRDQLPTGVQYLDDSLRIDGSMNDNDLFKDGITVNSLKKGESLRFTFKAKVLDSTEHCKKPGLRNVVLVNPKDLKEKSDDAFVKVCKPEVKKEQPVVVTLPETGPGAALGLFASTSVAGALAHRLVYRRYYR